MMARDLLRVLRLWRHRAGWLALGAGTAAGSALLSLALLLLAGQGVADRATFDEPTLMPTGISHVWVNGQAIVLDGSPTGSRPGRLIPQSP